MSSPIKLHDGGLLHSPWGLAHYLLVSLTFCCSIYMMGGSGEHVVMKCSLGDGDEHVSKVMMGTLDLGNDNGLSINASNNDDGSSRSWR